MDFDKVIEEWCMKYKPILHRPGERSTNKRFFLVDSIVNIPQIAASLSLGKSPCVAYEFHAEGEMEGSKIFPEYTISVLVKVTGENFMMKERSNEAVKEAFLHVRKLIAWLRDKRETDKSLENLDLEQIKYDTLGPLINNWYSVFFTITDTTCEKVYVDPNDYID